MVRSLLCLSTAILLGGATRAWEHLNHKSFHEAVNSHEHAVVAFLRSDDPGNAALEAEWIEAKGETSIPFLSVDCLAEPEHRVLCSSGLYDNSNLPVISMLQHGELRTTYPGPRRAAAILQWTNRAKRNPVVQELTASSLSAFKTADEAACVAFLPREDIVVDDHDSGSSHPAHFSLRQHWEHIAESTPMGGRVSMGLLVNPPAQTLTDQGLGKHLPAVKCWTNKEMKVGDKGAAAAAAAAATAAIANNPYVKTNKWLSRDKSSASKPLSGKAALAAGVPELRKFIADATRSVIGELTAENHEEYLQRGRPVVYIFAATEAERASLRASLSTSAASYADTLSIVTVDPFAFPGLQQKLGLFDPTPVPVVLARPQAAEEEEEKEEGETEEGREEVPPAAGGAGGDAGGEASDADPDADAATPSHNHHHRESTSQQPALQTPSVPEGASLVAQPGKPVGVLVQLWSGNIWHYPPTAGFTVKELMGWGLRVKIGGVKPFRAADPEWVWPRKDADKKNVAAAAADKVQEDRGGHDEL